MRWTQDSSNFLRQITQRYMMNVTTIAVISDTHAYLDPRIADIIRESDIAIHAGDICSSHILKDMRPKTGKVYAVAGNNDIAPHFAEIPAELEIALPGGKIAVEHGHLHGMQKPSHASLRKKHPQAKVIIYGHTHKMLQDKTELPWVINPGAAGKTRTRGGPSCLTVRCEDDTWEITEHRFTEENL